MKMIWGAAALLLPGVCSALAQDVRYNFDDKADFSKFNTYSWVKHPKSLDVDQLTLSQLAKGFDAALAQKGLKRVDSGPSDLVIVYQVALGQEKELTTFNSGWGYGPGWGGGWYGGMGTGISTTTTNTINIGSVALDMYDAATKQMVWRGVASKTINEKAKPEKRQKNIDKAAVKMLKNYPPPAKKK
jgi:hypothetical protein